MSKPRYSVYSVLGDGNVWTALETDSASEALAKLESEREKYASHRHHAHGITLTDDPERGDVTAELEEGQ